MATTKFYFKPTDPNLELSKSEVKQFAVGTTIDNEASEINLLEDGTVETIFDADVPAMEGNRIVSTVTGNLPLAFLRRETTDA